MYTPVIYSNSSYLVAHHYMSLVDYIAIVDWLVPLVDIYVQYINNITIIIHPI